MGVPFVFIISLIVAAAVVLFAVYAIRNFNCRQEQVLINTFIFDLKQEVEKAYYTTIGSQVTFSGTLPIEGCSNIKLICFAFPDKQKNNAGISEDVWFEISQYKGQNVQLFLYPASTLKDVGVQQAYNVRLLNVTQNPTCIQNKGDIELLFKNEGNYVLVEK